MKYHETQEAEQVAQYAHFDTEDQVKLRQMNQAACGIEEWLGDEERGNMLWDLDEELALLVDAELHFGVSPTVPFQRAIGLVRRAYRANYLGVSYEEQREILSQDEEHFGWD